MRPILALALSLSLALPLAAQDASSAESVDEAEPQSAVERWSEEPATIFDASQVTLDEFKWRARPVVVFADSDFDPAFQKQMDLLSSELAPMIARDVVIVTDTDPAANTALRRELRPRGFALVLINKEGRVTLRKPFPWSVREISHAIDKWPMRLQEVREGAN